MSVARALLNIARSGRTIACVVHQPSSKLFTMADDVIVLAEGRTLYAGSVLDIPGALGKAGFSCPQFYNVADFCEYQHFTIMVARIHILYAVYGNK